MPLTKALTSLLFVCSTALVFSQYQMDLIPRSSPDRAVYQKIGYTEVDIHYGSPAVNERTVWGELVPYDRLWRAGANNATTVDFSTSVSIQGQPLDSGRFALFIIPRESADWTVIFNKTADQWGAFRYSEDDDALRVQVSAQGLAQHIEHLSYTIQQKGYHAGSILMDWENVRIDIPFETNYLQLFKDKVDLGASQQEDYLRWIVYLQGAEHLIDTQSDLAAADRWLTEAEGVMETTSEWNEQFYPRPYAIGHLYWTKAKLLAQTEDYASAIEYVSRLHQLDNPLYYERKGQKENIDALTEQWTERAKEK